MNPIAPIELSDDELDTLEDFLYSEHVSEDSLDLVGVHGLFTACNISPKPVAEQDWLELVFDGKPNWASEAQQQEITALLRRLFKLVHSYLYSDQEIDLPCELTLEPEDDEDVAALTWWSQAFMEGVFMNEDAWFNHIEEEAVAEALLPIMVASELFEEDKDIAKMRKNKKLCTEMSEQIPDLLIDLYLLFHAPQK
ncbi:MAG: YecA family protein [Pontibacterium sp.]